MRQTIRGGESEGKRMKALFVVLSIVILRVMIAPKTWKDI